MKIINRIKLVSILGIVCYSSVTFAYTVGGTDKKCKPPKFRDLQPPERTANSPVPEVEPESEISFTVSPFADPSTIIVNAKKIPLKPNIVDKNSFYLVTAKLPAEITGKYARIDIRAKNQSAECQTKDGWLIKVKEASESASTDAD